MASCTIDDFRHEHESSAEWNLRRPFLEAHLENFDRNRLECLSSCFVNVELYGCKYPAGVMSELRQLSSEVAQEVQSHRDKVKARMEVKFVKSQEASTPQNSSSKMKGRVQFVPASDAFSSMDTTASTSKSSGNSEPATSASNEEEDQGTEQPNTATPSSKVVTQKQTIGKKKPPVKGGASTDKPISSSNIGSKILKQMGWEGGGLKPGGISEPVPISGSMRREGLGHSQPETPTVAMSNLAKSFKNIMSSKPNFNSTQVLHQAIQKEDLELSYTWAMIDDYLECCVRVDNILLGYGQGPAKKQSKASAANCAATILKGKDFKVETDKRYGCVLFSNSEESASFQSTLDIANMNEGMEENDDDEDEANVEDGSSGPGPPAPALDEIYQLAGIFRQRYSPPSAAVMSKLHEASQKAQVSMEVTFDDCEEGGFICYICVADLVLGFGTAESKKVAKAAAFDMAANTLLRPYFHTKFDPDHSAHVLQSAHEPFSNNPARSKHASLDMVPLGRKTAGNVQTLARGVKRKAPSSTCRVQQPPSKRKLTSFKNIVLYESAISLNTISPISTLTTTAVQNSLEIGFDFRREGENTVCDILLEGNFIASSEGNNQAVAKRNAAAAAIAALKQTCWTLQIKTQADTSEEGISHAAVASNEQKSTSTDQPEAASIHKPIESSNIGSKLLQQMGWQGGGLKPGAISEPVPMTTTIHRQGLGLSLSSDQGTDMMFLGKIREILQEYQMSEEQQDLTFSSEFMKEERAVIHNEAKKMGLQSKSYGQGSERYLTISRKRSLQQLVNYVKGKGGETDKYKLIAPGTFL